MKMHAKIMDILLLIRKSLSIANKFRAAEINTCNITT